MKNLDVIKKEVEKMIEKNDICSDYNEYIRDVAYSVPKTILRTKNVEKVDDYIKAIKERFF